MEVGQVGSVTNSTGTQVSQMVKEAVKTTTAQTKTDRVELSGRNPANKKELMATYSALRAQQPGAQKQALLNAALGKGSTTFQTPSIELAVGAQGAQLPKMDQTVQQLQVQRQSAQNVIQGPQAFATKNKVVGEGNTVQTAKGSANYNNAVTVNGAGNTVSLAGSAPKGVSAATYEATGGPGIKNTSVTVNGSANAVRFTGSAQKNNTLNVTGSNNSVAVGNAVNNAAVSVTGNNVKVTMADNNLVTKSQDRWNVNVNASNVSIAVENGKATVTGATEGLNIAIDNEKRTVTVTQKAATNASDTAV